MSSFCESTVEAAAIDWFSSLDYSVLHGPQIAPGELHAERTGFGETVLAQRLRNAMVALNPNIPVEALEDAFRKVTVVQHPSLIANNHAFHRLLVEGVPVEYQKEGRTVHDLVWLVDWSDPEANDWLVVNQFTVVEGQHNRRPDIVIFVNGLPLAVIELKNAADESADIWSAFNQFQTYKLQIPSLFVHNAVLVISDGLEARIGTISADRERFMPWRTITGETVAPPTMPQLEVMLRGVFEKRRFLDLVRHFIVFETDPTSGVVIKKMSGYHQFHAVNVAVAETLRASGVPVADRVKEPDGGYMARPQPGGAAGDRRIGVVWHTQGSGKSLTMVFYAGKLVLEPGMENPTIVMITDRNDLDDQLFGTFARCHELLRQKPVQAQSREHLRELLAVDCGGVVFTTMQKFFPEEGHIAFPELSKRRNIVVMADEAHRSQYGFAAKLDKETGKVWYGFAKYMRDALPNASCIAFTGTPVEKTDANTRAVFGEYISVYDILRAVEDKATVPIYYEGRLAKLQLKPEERPRIDPDFEEATEGEELAHKEQLKSKWAALEKIVGSENRLKLIAADLVKHWEARVEAMETQVPYGGKAMVVCMSRRICVDLYEQIRQLKPDWHSDDDKQGVMKVVMTGSADDPVEWQGHIRSKDRREKIANHFKDPKAPFKIVLVRDMWLTGFDVPCLTTMYVDKPMRSHALMQAIARVNRVFKDKPGGLVVDYLGLAPELKEALAVYTESQGKGEPTVDQEKAVEVMQREYERCCDFMHGLDWSAWQAGTPAQKLGLLPVAQEHVLAKAAAEQKPDEYKQKFLKAVRDLSAAFALAVPNEKAIEIRDDIGFFQAVRAALMKSTAGKQKSPDEVDAAIRQIISRAVASDEVVDIFAAAGLKHPDISILDDQFLAEVRDMPQKNLAVELLRKLLNDELKMRQKKFLIQSRSFAEMLEQSVLKYQNRAIEAAAVIQELIELAKEMREAGKRGEKLGLSDAEVAFYDSLEVNDSAVKVLGEPTLKTIARELVDSVRRNTTTDWTEREGARAKIRVMVKRILRKHGYPPDKQEKATQTVLQQAELLCADWAG